MNTDEKKQWWDQLEDQWKKAYNEAFFNKGMVLVSPTTEELDLLLSSPALRIVGPTGSYSNLSFQLTNFSGVHRLDALETLVLTDHKVPGLEGLGHLPKLRGFFIFNNQLKSLEGLEVMTTLEELYVNANELEDLEPLAQLPALTELNCAYNKIRSIPLPPNLKKLYCLPNDELPDAEIIRIERQEGILCRRG